MEITRINTIRIKTIVDEDFVNYKVPSMYIATISCNFKCCKDKNFPISTCQNSSWAKMPVITVAISDLIKRYLNNPITRALVFSGLEPLDQMPELISFLFYLRYKFNCQDDVVIYTGYKESEIPEIINQLKCFGNIVIKFGRYVPHEQIHFDEVLGVNLASSNQYGKRI